MSDQQYRGGMFDESASAGRVSGSIRFEPGVLLFETAKGRQIALPLEGLQIEDGGGSQRMIFFKHPDHENAVFTSDKRILKAPQLNTAGSDSNDVTRVRRRIFNRRALLTASLLLIGGGVFGVWLLKNVMVSVVVRNVPLEWEQALGKAAMASASPTLIEDAEAEQMLEKMLAPLLETAPPDAPPFEFHISRDDTINAFAAPGGYVVINSGLIEKAERPEQILGVVAHEMAHVTQRHGVRGIVDSMSIRLLLAITTGGTDMPAEWVDGGSRLLQLKHSRKQESEADEVGWKHLERAGIDPSGLEEFFRLVQNEHSHLSVELLSTHPAPASRIERLQQRSQAAAPVAPVSPELLLNLKEHLGLSP